MSSDNSKSYTFKILTLGDSAVGKSSILHRYMENKYNPNQLATIGMDFFTKSVDYQGKKIMLKIFDTAGQERFRNMTKNYYKGSDAVFLVFDITNRVTFDKIKEWNNELECNTDINSLSLLLIGNKADLSSKRAVRPPEAESLARSLGIHYLETSALNGQNIKEIFDYILEDLYNKKIKQPGTMDEDAKNIVINKKKAAAPEKKGGCC